MLLNDQLGIQLAMAEDAVVEQKKEVLHFRQYADLSHEEIEKLTLVVNRSGNHYFIPELKQVDYLLIIRTEGSLFAMKEAIQNLKGHKGIAMLTELDPDSIKSLRKCVITSYSIHYTKLYETVRDVYGAVGCH